MKVEVRWPRIPQYLRQNTLHTNATKQYFANAPNSMHLKNSYTSKWIERSNEKLHDISQRITEAVDEF